MYHSGNSIFAAHDVSIVFVDQKNQVKTQTATTEWGKYPLLNTAMQGAKILWHLNNAPGTNDSTQIYHLLQDRKLTNVTQTKILDYLR